MLDYIILVMNDTSVKTTCTDMFFSPQSIDLMAKAAHMARGCTYGLYRYTRFHVQPHLCLTNRKLPPIITQVSHLCIKYKPKLATQELDDLVPLTSSSDQSEPDEEEDSAMNKEEESEKEKYDDDDGQITEDDSTEVLLPSEPTTSSSNMLHMIPYFKDLHGFLKTYRSNDPQSRITPFAVILLAVISIVYVLNQADRLVLAVLIPSGLQCIDSNDNNGSNTSTDVCITEDHNSQLSNISDCISFDNTQQGLLTGPAFTVIYVVAGLPLAWLADTKSRPLVFLGGIAFWSAMVILMGFINNFWELLLLRIMLGVGEVHEVEGVEGRWSV